MSNKPKETEVVEAEVVETSEEIAAREKAEAQAALVERICNTPGVNCRPCEDHPGYVKWDTTLSLGDKRKKLWVGLNGKGYEIPVNTIVEVPAAVVEVHINGERQAAKAAGIIDEMSGPSIQYNI